jgi:hypothetical protein
VHDDDTRLINPDLLWAPDTDHLTASQLEAIRTRHANADRPIPSGTAMGYDHLMADADRGALLAERDRLAASNVAVLKIHRPVEEQDRRTKEIYYYCWECSDNGGDGSRGHYLWPCDTATAAGATAEDAPAFERAFRGY